jgi:CheY-like chemotaxis protein
MIKLLVSDDAGLMLALQGSFLNRSNCEVFTAATGEETLRRARAIKPDLMVLDAEMTGFKHCCRRLRFDRELRDTPVIVVGEGPGGDAVVAKPITQENLLEAMRSCVRLVERDCQRLLASLEVEYRREECTGVGFTKDISVDGMFLKSGDDLSKGDSLLLSFELPTASRPFKDVDGEVVRTVPRDPDSHLIPGAGIRFRGLLQRQRLALAGFVESGSGEES